MAVAFMVHQARLLNSFVIISAVLFSCNKSQNVYDPNVELLDANTLHLQMINGIAYKNGHEFTGNMFKLYPSSKDTAETFGFLNGRENGTWKKYYSGRKLKEIRYYEEGKKTGVHLAWWANGKKQLQFNLLNDEYEGNSLEWNESGLLIRDMNYVAGHEQGNQRLWWDDGSVRANYIIKDGRRYGLLGTKNCKSVSDSLLQK